jgi:hypothetical protein
MTGIHHAGGSWAGMREFAHLAQNAATIGVFVPLNR